MRAVLFYHSYVSCWNHGNAHFLRGICRELLSMGHEVCVYEPANSWSRTNALMDHGAAVLREAARLVPGVELRLYDEAELDLDELLADSDLVIVHEWNSPALVASIGRHRIRCGGYTLLFHDTHHRAVSAPDELEQYELQGYDGVLAFGEALRQVYLARGWADRVFTWHEAADTGVFRPTLGSAKSIDLIWIGNWGDGERAAELNEFLAAPAHVLGLRTQIHGVRYPQEVRDQLARRDIRYAGWLPNHHAPEAFARSRMTVHVPRRHYVEMLPGIPTIRVFEALACGIPLICAPWRDEENLFPAGAYLLARTGEAMADALSAVLNDRDLRTEMVVTGLRAIRERHSCSHRVRELMGIFAELRGRSQPHFPPKTHETQRIAQ